MGITVINDCSVRPQTVFVSTNLENHHEREIRQEESGRHLGDIWETSERYLGDVWETFERHLGDIWETSGRHVRDIWETSGETELPGVAERRKTMKYQYVNVKNQRFSQQLN